MTSRYDAVLFDLDGTLLYTLPDIHAALIAALRECGHPTHTLDDTRRYVGNGSRKLVERSLPGGADDPDLERTLAAYKRIYRENLVVETAPYPGIPELLAELKGRGLGLGCVTNKPDANAKYILNKCFPGVFAAIEGSRDDRPLKPSPEAARQAMATLGAAPERTLFVGDTDVDFFSAQSAGTGGVLVSWGFRPRAELEKLSPDALIDAPAELLDYI